MSANTINQRIENQISIEKHFSQKSVIENVNETVETFDMSSLILAMSDYESKLDVSNVYNHDLLQAVIVKHGALKLSKIVVRELIKCMLEKNENQFPLYVIAQRIGRKAKVKTFVKMFAKSKLFGEVVKPSFHNDIQVGVMLLEALKLEGIFTMTMIGTENGHMHGVKCLIKMDRKVVNNYNNTRFLPPLIVEPVRHGNGVMGGYHCKENKTELIDSANNPFVENTEQGDLVYRAINHLQETGLMIKSEFYNENSSEYLYETDKFKLITESKTFLDHHTMLMNETIYFAWKSDFRGRLYSKGHYINPQGDEFGKAELEFANKEMITDEGMFYLKSAIAGTYESINKFKIPQDKVDWFDNNETEILNGILVPKSWEEKYTFRSLLIDYKDAVAGKPIGTILHLDATNSALQIYAVLTGDKMLARMCNLFDDNTGLQDGYQMLADSMNDTFSTDLFNRDNIKRPFMVFLYGAGKKRIVEGVNGEWKGLGEILPTENADTLWDGFENTLKELVPGAYQAMEMIYELVNADKTLYQFTTPGMFHVSQYCYDNVERQVEYKWNGERKTLTAYELVMSSSSKVKALAPNFVHSLDSYLLHKIVDSFRALNLDIVTIHDSFGVHPNNASKLIELYKKILAEMLGENIFNIFRKEVAGHVVKLLVKGDLKASDILNSKYPLN
jgi:DNA-directed RNA polymerase